MSSSSGPSSLSHGPASSLRRQQLLSEENYISSLSSLIQRDFFPNLPRVTAENEYLSALEDMDAGVDGAEERVKEAERILDQLDRDEVDAKKNRRRARRAAATAARPSHPVTPKETPVRPSRGGWDPTPLSATADTPRTQSGWATPRNAAPDGRDASDDFPVAHFEKEDDGLAQPPDLSNHSISSFQHHFTSEDNASFLSLVQSTNDRRKERYAWAFQQERTHNARRKLIMDQASRRADEGYARSILTLPESKRRRLIQGGKLEAAMKERIGELQQLDQQTQDKQRGKSKTDAMKLTYDMSKSHRAIRASSEEGTPSSSSQGLALAPPRPRSSSPPTLRPLKHSLDPRSEVSLIPIASNSKLPDDSEMEDPSFDPQAILRPSAVAPTTATTYGGTKYAARNAFFFGPDAEISTTDRVTSSLPESMVEGTTSAEQRLFHAREKLRSKTLFHNTALPSQGIFPEERYPDLLAGEKGKDTSSDMTTSATSPRSSRVESALGGGSQYGDHFDEATGEDLRYAGPTVNGFGFVSPAGDLTPNRAAMEEEFEERRKSRLLSIQRGSASSDRMKDAPPRTFFLPPTPRRDELATSLANRSASARNRYKNPVGKGNTVSSSSSSRSGSGSGSGSGLNVALGITQKAGRRTPRTNPPPSLSTSTPTSRRRTEALSPAARSMLDRTTLHGRGRLGLGGFFFPTPPSSVSVSATPRHAGKTIRGKKELEEVEERKRRETLGGVLGRRAWEDEGTPRRDRSSSSSS